MAYDLAVRGQLVTADGVHDGWISVEQGRISRVSSGQLEARQVVDFGRKLILPGVIDLHAHFSEPGRTHWEGWATGSRSAAAGGITTVVDMPLNAIPATVNRHAFDLKKSAAEHSSLIDFALWGGLVDNNLSELSDLLTTGVMGIKAFMVDTKDETFRYVRPELLLQGMQMVAKSRLFLAVHAEDNEGTWARTKALQEAGRTDRQAWCEARSPENELKAIESAIALAKQTGCRLHVVHVSLPEGIDALLVARYQGVEVTWETCAHYLALTDQDFIRVGPEAKCAPPLRDPLRQEALWERILNDQVDAITSDHSPCPPEDKMAGENDIWKAWGGISGIQALLPVVITEGVVRRGLTWPHLAKLMCSGPARLAGLDDRKGALVEGLDADFVVVDPERTWTLSASDLHCKHPHSPYLGRRFRGFVEASFVRGSPVWLQGRFSDEHRGRFLPHRHGGPL